MASTHAHSNMNIYAGEHANLKNFKAGLQAANRGEKDTESKRAEGRQSTGTAGSLCC